MGRRPGERPPATKPSRELCLFGKGYGGGTRGLSYSSNCRRRDGLDQGGSHTAHGSAGAIRRKLRRMKAQTVNFSRAVGDPAAER